MREYIRTTLPNYLLLLTSTLHLAASSPFSHILADHNSTLVERGCESPCGYYGQLCCDWGHTCYTDYNNEAQCGSSTPAPAATGGYWEYYTTTLTQTDLETITSVYSTWMGGWTPASTTPYAPAESTTAPLVCDWDSGESSCGDICCTNWQYCVVSGQCGTTGGQTTPAYSSYSAPLRPTLSTPYYVTATVTPTTTVPFEAPVETGANVTITSTNSSGGLTSGEIAGIVIGVIIGVILLILLALLLCFRAAWDGLLALIGLGPRRRTTVVEERYTHHGSRHSDRWYGDRPGRPPPPPKRNSGLGWLGVGGGLAGLAVLLGAKRRQDERRRREEKSEYTASTSYYSDYTSSSTTEDRRTNVQSSPVSKTRPAQKQRTPTLNVYRT